MDQTAVEDSLVATLGSLYALLSSGAVEQAITTALREVGWDLPVESTDKDRCFWTVERARRHCLDMVRTEAAYKFDYKQVKLSNRFHQLDKMITDMDARFEEARLAMPSLFSSGTNTVAQFGSYITPGFAYSNTGIDYTYTDIDSVSASGDE